MKYIMFEYPALQGVGVPVIFPSIILHKDIQLPVNKNLGKPVAVSAGFVNDRMETSGGSIGLDLYHRPQDRKHILIAFSDFG